MKSLFAFVAGIGLVSQVFAVEIEPTRTWTGASGGNWSVAENWSPVGVPTEADDVQISGAWVCTDGSIAQGLRI